MFNFGTSELILVLVIALVVFGPGKLPEVGKAIGKGINEFKGAMNGEKNANDDAPIDTTAKATEAKKSELPPLGNTANTHVEEKKKD